ncbi:MAG: hypothetical protein IIB71_13210 [Proteobacteria bacterium]|nr:hypothetical protein [Pseudomonadota bacterium]
MISLFVETQSRIRTGLQRRYREIHREDTRLEFNVLLAAASMVATSAMTPHL